jgi:formate dehydrogenase (NADP+) beta subunit
MLNLEIDGRKITAPEGKSVLDAALDAGIYIPHLCYHPDLPSVDDCKLCVVEIDGMEGLPTACTIPAADGMTVRTATEKVKAGRKQAMAQILSGHPQD